MESSILLPIQAVAIARGWYKSTTPAQSTVATTDLWNATFGVNIGIVQVMANLLAEKEGICPSHLLIFLYFITCYLPIRTSATWAGVTEKTFQKIVANVLDCLYTYLPRVSYYNRKILVYFAPMIIL